MHLTQHLIERARQFASALDACDYDAAADLLAAKCRYYLSPNEFLIGPASIISSYRESDEKARREFDHVAYSSEVQMAEPSRVTLIFSDQLRRGIKTHTFRCSQIIDFDDAGKINRVELREIAGEREKLNEFRKRSVND